GQPFKQSPAILNIRWQQLIDDSSSTHVINPKHQMSSSPAASQTSRPATTFPKAAHDSHLIQEIAGSRKNPIASNKQPFHAINSS
ncbi:hypothetical protein ACLOJK_036384, partial [Asimina triloba]